MRQLRMYGFIQFGQEVMDLLNNHGDMLDSDLRKALVHALVLLRKRSQVQWQLVDC